MEGKDGLFQYTQRITECITYGICSVVKCKLLAWQLARLSIEPYIHKALLAREKEGEVGQLLPHSSVLKFF